MIISKTVTRTLAAALLLAGAITPASADQDPAVQQHNLTYEAACLANESCVREVFTDIVLGNRFDRETDHFGRVIKWTDPVRLSYEDGDTVIDEVVRTTITNMELAAIDAGLPVLVSDASSDGQATEISIEMRDDPALFDGRICTGRLDRKEDAAEPVGAWIAFSNAATPPEASHCVALWLLRVFGLVSRTPFGGFPSLLSNNVYFSDGDVTLISPMDEMLLSILYDPGIDPGMTRDQIKIVFPAIYASKSSAPNDIAKTPDLLEPIDQATLACMADPICSRDMFVRMTVLGSTLEPRNTDSRFLAKRIGPASIQILIGEQTTKAMKQAAYRGLDYALTMADIIGIPHILVDAQTPASNVNQAIFVSPNLRQDFEEGSFRTYLNAGHMRTSVVEAFDALSEGHLCSVNVESVSVERLGIIAASEMIPATADMTPWWIERCVIEETMQAFGLVTDIDGDLGIATLFDDRLDNFRMTAFDLFMNKLLYHPTLEPGMDQELINALFDDVYKDVWQEMLSDHWWVPDDLRGAQELQM